MASRLAHAFTPTLLLVTGLAIGCGPSDLADSDGARLLSTLAAGGSGPASTVSWGFDTNGDREGWTLDAASDFLGGPSNGGWIFIVPGADPKLTSPALNVDAAALGTLRIRMANDHNPADGSQLQVFWAGPGQGFAEARSAVLAVSNSGGWATYTLDLAASPLWTGTIERLRVDPIRHGSGHGVGIDFIELDEGTPSNPPPPAQTALVLGPRYLSADATTTRGVSAWGTESVPWGQSVNQRSLTFWGRFGNGACASPGYGETVEHALARSDVTVFRAAFPDCGGAYGPSVEADVHAFGAPQHLLRTEVTAAGAFQDYGPSGQNATGANAFIQAAYVGFDPAWQTSDRLRPFSGTSADPARIRMAVRAKQSVTEATLEEPNVQQLQQVIRMVLINEACNIGASSSFCQIELNFKTYIRGVGAYASFDQGDAFNDGGQGGLIAVVGPINSTGASTTVDGTSAWTSWGAPTQQGTFTGATFQVETTWDQFQNLLVAVTGGRPADVFGARWQDRNAWVLLRLGYGQENYNRSSSARSAIEGLFERLEVFAL